MLYVEYGLLSSSLDYFRENPRILLGILGYGAIMSVTASLVLAAIASWVPRTVPLVMTWAGVFVMLPAVGAALWGITQNKRCMVVSLWSDLFYLGSWCFGAIDKDDGPLIPWAVWIVPAVCLICLGLFLHRVRAVEVVR